MYLSLRADPDGLYLEWEDEEGRLVQQSVVSWGVIADHIRPFLTEEEK